MNHASRAALKNLKTQCGRLKKHELLAMGQHGGIFDDKDAQGYLFYDLNKKRGRFDTCTKSQLAEIFYHVGITEIVNNANALKKCASSR
jgi:hypothetical protein